MRRQPSTLPTRLLPLVIWALFLCAIARPAYADEAAVEPAAPEEKAPVADDAADEAKTATEAPAPMKRPYLWVVECRPRLFFCGTIHLDDPRVLAQPASVKAAIEQSEVVLTEIDLRKPDLTSASRIMRLPDGHLLSNMLPKELYERTAAILKKSGVDIKTLEHTKIWAVTFRLQFSKPGASETAKADTKSMDAALAEQAVAAGKDVSGLESIVEQLQVFDSLDLNEQIRMLESAVTAVESAEQGKPSSLTALVDIYLKGDEKALYRFLCADADPYDQGACCFMRKLLDCRNRRIVNRVLTRRHACGGNKTMFVAVGAGHYPGPRGILSLLRQRGYRVRRVESAAELQVTTTAPAVHVEPSTTVPTVQYPPGTVIYEQPTVIYESPVIYEHPPVIYHWPQRRRVRRAGFRFPFFQPRRCR